MQRSGSRAATARSAAAGGSFARPVRVLCRTKRIRHVAALLQGEVRPPGLAPPSPEQRRPGSVFQSRVGQACQSAQSDNHVSGGNPLHRAQHPFGFRQDGERYSHGPRCQQAARPRCLVRIIVRQVQVKVFAAGEGISGIVVSWLVRFTGVEALYSTGKLIYTRSECRTRHLINAAFSVSLVVSRRVQVENVVTTQRQSSMSP